MNTPLPISLKEWEKIIKLPQIREMWELTDSDTAESFSASVYGARFVFKPKSPHDAEADFYIIYSGDSSGFNAVIKRLHTNLAIEE